MLLQIDCNISVTLETHLIIPSFPLDFVIALDAVRHIRSRSAQQSGNQLVIRNSIGTYPVTNRRFISKIEQGESNVDQAVHNR